MRLLAATALVGLMTMASPARSQVPTPVSLPGVSQLDVEDLLGDLELWNGQRISLTGELVGDYSRRPDGIWVQVNDDAFVSHPIGAGGEPLTINQGIGARVPAEIFRVEGPPGRYGRMGPVVQLIGVFRHNDPALSGETYLDVDRLIALQPAQPYQVPGPNAWLAVGVILIIAAAAMAAASRRRTNWR